MKTIALMILATNLVACGVHVTSDPVKVEHEITINMEPIEQFCSDICSGESTEDSFNSCKNDCVKNLLNFVSSSSGG